MSLNSRLTAIERRQAAKQVQEKGELDEHMKELAARALRLATDEELERLEAACRRREPGGTLDENGAKLYADLVARAVGEEGDEWGRKQLSWESLAR